jgi:hypothetical protein
LASSLCGAGWFGERCQGRNAVLALVNAARWLLGSFSPSPAAAAAAEDGRRRGPGGTDGPVSGNPVDDDRGCGCCGPGAGERERAEHAAFDTAEPAGQRDEPPGQLPGGVGEQQPAPRHWQPGQPETSGEQARVGEQARDGARQHPGRPAEPRALA